MPDAFWSPDANSQVMTYDSEGITSNLVLCQSLIRIYLFMYLFLEFLMEL